MYNVNVDENYYQLLGVERTASAEVIRDSYRRLMQTAANHPDRGGDTHTAAQINKAYAVLKDPARRGEYDLRLTIIDQVSDGIDFQSQAQPIDPSRHCVFCEQQHPYGNCVDPMISCDGCGCPLATVDSLRFDESGQRGVKRLGKSLDVAFFSHWTQSSGHLGKTEDISPHGLRLVTRSNVRPGDRIRIISKVFEAVGEIRHVAARRNGWRGELVAGVSFLTMRLLQTAGGFVSRRA